MTKESRARSSEIRENVRCVIDQCNQSAAKDEAIDRFITGMVEMSSFLQSSADLQYFVAKLQQCWGGFGGDDWDIQIITACLDKAVWKSSDVDAKFEETGQMLDG